MSKRYFVIVIILLVIIVSIIFFQMQHRNDQFVVGGIMPLTGDVATYGIAIKQGIEIAIDKVNSQGGVNGKLISVVYEDSKAEPKEGISVFNKLVSINNVNVIIGAVASSVTLAIAPKAEEEHVILFSPASSSPEISKAGDYIFRNYPSDDLEGKIVAEHAYSRGFENAAILTINNDYGIGLNKVFKDEFMQLGGIILSNDLYNEDQNNFETILTKINQKNPKCIFIVGYGKELGKIVKQARHLGIKAQFFSTVNFYDENSLISGGNAVEGVVFSSPVFDSNSANINVQIFVESFESKFGKKPDVWSAHSYDALLIIAEAINEANSFSVDQIKKEIYQIKDFDGVSGKTSFDENGDVFKEAKFLTVKNGEFVSLMDNNTNAE